MRHALTVLLKPLVETVLGRKPLITAPMVQAILAAEVPVVAYVAPSGARAASAGTFLMYASHVAAMSPATNLGAATPVQTGGPSAGRPDEDKPEGKDGKPAPAGGALDRKALNDSIAYIRNLAELRGRNVEWAERAVREALSLPASEALELKVIDLVATDLADLLKQVNGRIVKMDGQAVTLDTANAAIDRVQPDWRSRLLAVIGDPAIAYILMLLGIYGVIYEFSNPGMPFPGVVGGIATFKPS